MDGIPPTSVAVQGGKAAVTAAAGATFDSLAQDVDSSPLIYVARAPDGFDQVFCLPANGRTPIQITTTPQHKEFPSLSPDGTRIVFGVTDVPNFWQREIYTMPTGGGQQTKISDLGSRPLWSPDSTRIAFTYEDPEVGIVVRIVDANGGNAKDVGDSVTGAVFGGWSPDGKRVLYSTFDQKHLFTASADGSDPKEIPINRDLSIDDHFMFPVWSPDGKTIVYIGRDQRLCTVPITGGTPTRLPADGLSKVLGGLCWSPDSQSLIFGAFPDQTFDYKLYSVSAFGSAPTPIGTGLWPNYSLLQAGPKPITFIGGNNSLFELQACAGILAGVGPEALSVLVADTGAQTPEGRAQARVTPINYGGTDVLYFTITAPSGLRTIRWVAIDWANGTHDAPAKFDLTTTYVGVIVGVDANSGKVKSVALFPAPPGVSNAVPEIVQQGSETVLKGRILTVIDGAGTIRADNGAREVHLDPQTGEILSIR
jgi:Tol biopolymer transport system component